jgi:Histone methylation protein DOT1
MPWSSKWQQRTNNLESAPDLVTIAGDLVSKFLRRPTRKRRSTMVAASDLSSPLGDDDDDDAGDTDNPGDPSATKPNLIAAPTSDQSTTTRSRTNGSHSGGAAHRDNVASSARGGSKQKRLKTEISSTKGSLDLRGTHSSVPSKPYQPKCYAIISENGSRCSSWPLSQGRYCEIHTRSKSSEKNRSRYLPEACDELDLWYYGDDGTSQCLAITAAHRRCAEMSVKNFEMCRRHLKYPPKRCLFLPESRPSLAEKVGPRENDDSDISSGGWGEADSESDLETQGNEDDITSDESDDDNSSMTSSDDDWKSPKEASGDDRPIASKGGPTDRCRKNAGSTQTTSQKSRRVTASSSLRACRVDATATFDTSGVGYNEPTEFDHSKDRLFSGEGKQLQCYFESSDGRRCLYQRKRGTDIYCNGHDILTPQILESMAKNGFDFDSSDSGSTTSRISSEDDDNDIPTGNPRPYTHREFVRLWKNFEELYMSTDEIENSKQVRGANQSMCPDDTDGQEKAQYGRLLPRAMKVRKRHKICARPPRAVLLMILTLSSSFVKRIIDDILGLTMDDVFLDIGHGIGNTCMHAAFTVGCEARGIEVVYSRNFIATAFRDNLVGQHRQLGPSRIAGEVKFRHGRLEDEIHRDFLTKGVTKAIVNNFNGVFAERSVKNKSLWFLDDYCAGIFGLMAPGTSMVTLHPLSLGPSLEQANAARRKHKLPESSNASFYRVEQVVLGKACDTVKWNKKSGNENLIYVYRYTRLKQERGSMSVFLCCNPQCVFAKENVPIPATTINDEGRCVINRCECGVAAKMLRQRKSVPYS